jgi:hypothetical protein
MAVISPTSFCASFWSVESQILINVDLRVMRSFLLVLPVYQALTTRRVSLLTYDPHGDFVVYWQNSLYLHCTTDSVFKVQVTRKILASSGHPFSQVHLLLLHSPPHQPILHGLVQKVLLGH